MKIVQNMSDVHISGQHIGCDRQVREQRLPGHFAGEVVQRFAVLPTRDQHGATSASGGGGGRRRFSAARPRHGRRSPHSHSRAHLLQKFSTWPKDETKGHHLAQQKRHVLQPGTVS